MENPSFITCVTCGAAPDAQCPTPRVHKKGWRAPCVLEAEREETEFREFQIRHKIAEEHDARIKAEREANAARKARAREDRGAWIITVVAGIAAAYILATAWAYGLIGG